MLGHGTLALLAQALRGAGLSNDRRASKEAWGFTRTSPNFAARADTPCCPQHGGNGGGGREPIAGAEGPRFPPPRALRGHLHPRRRRALLPRRPGVRQTGQAPHAALPHAGAIA